MSLSYNCNSRAKAQIFVNSELQLTDEDKHEIMQGLGILDHYVAQDYWNPCQNGHQFYNEDLTNSHHRKCPECHPSSSGIVNCYIKPVKLTARKVFIVNKF